MRFSAVPKKPAVVGAEFRQVIQLLFCFLVVVCTWYLIGFRADYSAMGNDAGKSFLPIMSILHDINGDWPAMVYRPEYFGGVNLLGLQGVLPFSVILIKAGASTLWTLNLDLFIAQALIGYLSIQAVRMLAAVPTGFSGRGDLVVSTCLVWAVAFAPFMGWRINLGHLSLIYGLVGFVALVTLWIGVTTRRLGRVTAAVALLALVNAFCVQGFQVLLLGAIFCAPLLAGIAAVDPQFTWKRSVIAGFVCIGAALMALLVAAPVFLAMLDFATGIDTTRQPGHDIAIYSYFVAGWRELTELLMWFGHDVSRLNHSMPVESRFGLGPILVLMMSFAGRDRWPVLVGLGVSLVSGIVLVTNLQPVSGWILHLPFVADFRVPIRLFIPLTWLCTAVVASQLLSRVRWSADSIDGWTLVVIGTTAALTFLLSNIGRELLAWLLAGVVLMAVLSKRTRNVPAVLAVLLALNIQAFMANSDMDRHARDALNANRDFGRTLLGQHPNLRLPLNRVDVDATDFNLDMSPVGKITSITGYGYPHRQFSILMHDLVGVEFSPTRTFFNATLKTPNYYVPRQLYNIRYRLEWVTDTRASLVPAGPTPGPVWSSIQRVFVADQHQLDRRLVQDMAHPGWQLSQFTSTEGLSADRQAACAGLGFKQPVGNDHDTRLTVRVVGKANGECPVTASMTWSSNLDVAAMVDGRSVSVRPYPAYGALVGFGLPAGTTSFTIEARLEHYRLSLILSGLGLLLSVLLVLTCAGYRSEDQSVPV